MEPAAGEHGLDDVAHARDPEPDERAEIGQQPPVLGKGKSQKGRNEGVLRRDYRNG